MLLSEGNFIQRFHDYEDTAWEEIWDAHYTDLLTYTLRYVVQTDEREDIVVSAYEGLFRNRFRLEHKEDIRLYLFASVRNSCFKYLKNQALTSGRQKELSIVLDYQQAHAEYQKWVRDVIMEIMLLINSLPELEKKVFLLSYVDGLSSQEISEQLGIAISTVYNNKSIALKKLRELASKSDLRQDIKYMVLFILMFTDAFIPK